LKGAAHTPRADLYAAGLIGYHLLAGKLPFRAARFAELLEQHERGTFSKPSAHTRISGYVDGLIVRALAREPERRWPDAATFREAAKEIAKGL
jgi:eukaryotic-like serine/threonine-protein kinase